MMPDISLTEEEAQYIRADFSRIVHGDPTGLAILAKVNGTKVPAEEKVLIQAVAALHCISDFYVLPHDAWKHKYGADISPTNPGRTFCDLCNYIIARADRAGVMAEKDLAKRLLGTSHR